jgi:hypothetical protein
VELEAAKAKDVQAAIAAERQGKPAPKTRTNTNAAEQRLKELEFEQAKAEGLYEAALADMRAAEAEHGATYLRNAQEAADDALDAFHEAVNKLPLLHAELSQLLSLARSLGAERPGAGAIRVLPKQIDGLEVVKEHQYLTGWLSVADAITGLADIGKPVEPEEGIIINPITGQRSFAPPTDSILASAKHAAAVSQAWNNPHHGFPDAGVDKEMAERDAFFERAAGEKG